MSRTVLITGGSGGFGRRTAEILAEGGHRVFVATRGAEGRRKDELAVLAGLPKVSLIDLELNDEGSVQSALDFVRRESGGLDALVHAAGQALFGLVEATSPQQMRDHFELNLIGTLRIVRAAMPLLRAQAPGSCVVLLSSGLGRVVLPGMGVYAAGKAALESLGEALSYELHSAGIEVTLVQPGSFRTRLLERATVASAPERELPYGALAFLPRRMASHVPDADPVQVAVAIAGLVEMAPGQRPLRRVIDPLYAERIEQLNAAHATAQSELLNAMGLGYLCTS